MNIKVNKFSLPMKKSGPYGITSGSDGAVWFAELTGDKIGRITASGKWKISDRRIQVICDEGRIEGAVKIGRNWSIPDDAVKPADAREVTKKTYIGLGYDFSYIDSLKEEIDRHRPLSRRLVDSLHEKLIVEWTYNSNAIEGNTLTLPETKVVL